MNIEQRQEFSRAFFNECLDVLQSKGAAYSGGTRANANFVRSAEDADLSKYQIWQVFFNKHKDSIKMAIRKNPHQPVEATEGMRGRILDAVNYLVILAALLEEDGILDAAPAATSSLDKTASGAASQAA